MDQIKLAYTAGIIDGEGSISLTRQKAGGMRSPVVTVPSTTIELLDFLKSEYGGVISSKKVYQDHHKPSWTWAVRGRKSLTFLELVFPYLLVPEKKYRTSLLLGEYLDVTPRNGKYSDEMLASKIDFESRFLGGGAADIREPGP